MEVYTYSWHCRESRSDCRIVAYGISSEGENVQLSFAFSPRCYVALPSSIEWTDLKLKHLKEILRNKILTNHIAFVEIPKLYGGGVASGEWKKFPFLYCVFKTRQMMYESEKNCKTLFVPFLGSMVSLAFHETKIHPIVQAVTRSAVNFTGWLKIPRECVKSKGDRTFGCLEVEMSQDQLETASDNAPPHPLVMNFDLETYSENWLKFPNPDVVEDCIFQISCVFQRGDATIETFLLCMLECDPVEGATVRVFPNEYTLIKGFVALVTEKNPHIICGYNIMKFDLPYLIKRAKLHLCDKEFAILGFPKFVPGTVTEKKWSSAAYSDQSYFYLDIEGRVYVDLLPFVEKTFKLENYKLSTVAREFLKDDKVDMDVQTMFKSFKMALKRTPGAAAAMAQVARYCIHDSILVSRLFVKLQVWVSLVEMSRVVHCPVSDILLRGQQIRVFNSIVKYCFKKMVIVKPPLEEDSRYAGAFVFDPVPGMYENVVPFDFASLYPSTIIAYNIDYATLVTDDESIKDSDCHTFVWEDHISCKHDPKVIRIGECTEAAERADLKKKLLKNVICAQRRFRFVKTPEGVLPSIIKGCLAARKETRRLLAQISKTSSDWTILNQRQLAYKVSANSIYGFTGIGEKGMLSLLPLAMCITQRGRENVKRAAEEMSKRYGAFVVYGDTDSNYVTFPTLSSSEAVWDLSVRAASEISSLFPQPMELEFEETIYSKFLLLAKKKYVFQKMDRSGLVDGEIGKIGVVLNRRDNCKFIRDVYQRLVEMVFENASLKIETCLGEKCCCKLCIVATLVDFIEKLETRLVTIDDLTMTKGCRDYGDEEMPKEERMGSYKIRLLPEEPAAKIKKLGSRTESEFYASQLPAAAQLKKRMERRGLAVTEGSRVEFVMVRYGGAKQGDNIESVDYYREFSGVIKVDTHYYMNLLVAPLDQILKACFGMGDVIKRHVQLRIQKRAVCEAVTKLFSPRWPQSRFSVKRSSQAVGTTRVVVWNLKEMC
jgi:DNA polymerase elongation subunit (family B)